MKLNIVYPQLGTQKVFDIDDDKKLASFYDKRMAQEVEGDALGDEFKGYVFRITGGNDQQGFPMMQGVLQNNRVRLLLTERHKCYRTRRDGERRRKSVRGCIVGPDLAVLNLAIVKKGESDIPDLTNPEAARPRRLGPKRANHIRKLFNLSKEDDVRKEVIRREVVTKTGKKFTKAPKIQRLITPVRLQRKRRELALKRRSREKAKRDAAEYARLYQQRVRERRASEIARRRSSRLSRKSAHQQE